MNCLKNACVDKMHWGSFCNWIVIIWIIFESIREDCEDSHPFLMNLQGRFHELDIYVVRHIDIYKPKSSHDRLQTIQFIFFSKQNIANCWAKTPNTRVCVV